MSNGGPLPCDATCQKIIIDGRIMKRRAQYLISILDDQEDFAQKLSAIATPAEKAKLLANSQAQCDFSKLIEQSANDTAYLMSEIEKAHAGMPDHD
jgi:hypothetical protein